MWANVIDTVFLVLFGLMAITLGVLVLAFVLGFLVALALLWADSQRQLPYGRRSRWFANTGHGWMASDKPKRNGWFTGISSRFNRTGSESQRTSIDGGTVH